MHFEISWVYLNLQTQSKLSIAIIDLKKHKEYIQLKHQPTLAKMKKNINTASAYFNENWQRYLSAVQNNTLYHQEMLSALDNFLNENLGNRSFSFLDIGCGDSRTVVPILLKHQVKKYIGIDAAQDVLKMAEENTAMLGCEKEFIAEDMLSAITRLSSPVDIIYTSYAIHHLSIHDKTEFIQQCKRQLNPNGFLLMIDGVLKPNQTREGWLDSLQARMKETIPDLTAEEIATRMEHPRRDDNPDAIATFSKISQQQAWKDFRVIVDKGIFAFMVFCKD